jgi:hypothetical protein
MNSRIKVRLFLAATALAALPCFADPFESVYFDIGPADPDSHFRLGYGQGPLNDHGFATFDLVGWDDGFWQWSYLPTPSSDPISAMDLTTSGKLTLLAPTVTGSPDYRPWLEFDPVGKLTFGNSSAGTLGTLEVRSSESVNERLFFNNSKVLTTANFSAVANLGPLTAATGKFTVNANGEISIAGSSLDVRKIGIGDSAYGTALKISAGSATATNYAGGALILSSGAVVGGGTAGASEIEFKTAHTGLAGGVPETKMRILGTGAVGLGSGAFFGGPSGDLVGLDVSYGGYPATLLLGAEINLHTRTNETVKMATVGTPHFLNTQQPASILTTFTTPWENILRFGGGSSMNAATRVEVWGASNTTTAMGTLRLAIDYQGNLLMGENATAPSGGTNQAVFGKFNRNAQGSLIVGSGTNSTTLKNGLRVTEINGEPVVLVPKSGDISMGEFGSGEEP